MRSLPATQGQRRLALHLQHAEPIPEAAKGASTADRVSLPAR